MRCILLYAGLYAVILQRACATNVTLGWNPPTDPNVANYNIYYGVASQVYTNQIPAGTNTTATITGLAPGTSYYFAATTTDINGMQSGYSPEISYLTPSQSLLPCSVTLGNLNQIYNGQPALVSVSTDPTNVPVAVTYGGSPTPPANAGSYTVIATVVSSTYTGSATNTLVVTPAAATVTLSGLAATYNGSPQAVIVTTSPVGLATTTTYNGISTAPVNVGSYAVVSTINNPNYTGGASGTLVISGVTATVVLGNLAQIYTGNACPVTATTTPNGLPVNFTYNGSPYAPTNSGSYTVVGTISGTNYSASATNTLVISPATATVTLSGLTATYNGSPHAATVATSPAGLTTTTTYNGGSISPSNAGSYTVVCAIVDGNHIGAATNTLTINKAAATVALGGLSQTYNGTARAVTVTPTPSNLVCSVTYKGSSVVPTNAGSYTVVGTIVDSNYTGSAANTLTISKAVAAIAFGGLTQTYNGTARAVAVTTTPGNLVCAVTYKGSSVVPTNAGSYTLVGTIVDSNYTGSATNTLTIGKAGAAIAFGGLSQTYNGTPRRVTVTTTPAGLACTITYNGATAAPKKIGQYTVVATIVNSNYMGSATNTLTVSKAGTTMNLATETSAGAKAPAIVQLGSLIQACTGNPCPATVATLPAGLNVTVTYNGSNQAPCDIGTYAVVASVNDANYCGTVASTLTIKQVTPPSNLVLVSWSSAFSGVTLLESSNMVDWVTNTEPANVETASSDASGAMATAVAGQSGGHFFRALSNGAGIPLTIRR